MPIQLRYRKQAAKGVEFRLDVQSSGQERLCHLPQQDQVWLSIIEPCDVL